MSARSLHPGWLLILWIGGLLLVSLANGCLTSLDDRRQDVATPPGVSTPVVQGLLNPQATIQEIWVEWSIPADSSDSGGPRPVDPALVSLHLIGPDSLPRPVLPGTPGQFTVQLQILPDSLYRLEGSIGDSLVLAEVRVPDSVRLQVPATDTVRVDVQGFKIRLPYQFEARGATVYFIVDQSATSFRLSGTSGVVNLFSFNDTLRVRIEAYEPYAGDWILPDQRPSPSNITGAYGYLGAFVQSRMVVVIPQ